MICTNRQAREIHFHSDDLLELFRLQRQVDLPLTTTMGDNQRIQGNHNGLGLAHSNQTLNSNN